MNTSALQRLSNTLTVRAALARLRMDAQRMFSQQRMPRLLSVSHPCHNTA